MKIIERKSCSQLYNAPKKYQRQDLEFYYIGVKKKIKRRVYDLGLYLGGYLGRKPFCSCLQCRDMLHALCLWLNDPALKSWIALLFIAHSNLSQHAILKGKFTLRAHSLEKPHTHMHFHITVRNVSFFFSTWKKKRTRESGILSDDEWFVYLLFVVYSLNDTLWNFIRLFCSTLRNCAQNSYSTINIYE